MDREMQKSAGFYGATGLVAAGTLLSRILGLAREQVFAFYFGAGVANDAFQIAFRIPNLLRNLFAEGAMSSALVPVYAKERKDKGEDAAWRLVSSVVTALALILGVIAILGILSAGWMVEFYAPGFSEVAGKQAMTVHLTRILWPFLPLVVMAAVWMAVLNARERFVVPALAPALFNVVSIAAAFTLCPLVAWAFGWHPIYGMAIGAVLGGAAQWLVQYQALKQEGFHFFPRVDWQNPNLRQMIFLMGAGTLGLAATQINIFVNSLLASGQGNGAVSWLNYAFRLMQFPIGVFGVAISTASLTRVAQHSAEGNTGKVSAALAESLRMVIVLTVPSAVGLALVCRPLISLIYERGQFLAADTNATALALAGYSVGLTAYAAVKVLVPTLYALGRAHSALWASAFTVLINFLAAIWLTRVLGFPGLALATSIAAVGNAAVLLWVLQNCLKKIDFVDLARCLAASLGASSFMAIIVYAIARLLSISLLGPIPLTGGWVKANFAGHLIFLSIAVTAGAVAYAFAGRVFGLQEIERIQELVWKRLKQRRDKQ